MLSVTQIHAGDTWNVIPNSAILRGTVRTFRRQVQDNVEASMARISQGVATALGASATLSYDRRYPATVNTRWEESRR